MVAEVEAVTLADAVNRFEQIGFDVRHGVRALRHAPGFAIVAMLSLALGIGANAAIFSIINAVLLKPLPVPAPERLVQIVAGQQREFTTALWEQLRDRQQVLDGVMAWAAATFDLAAGGERRVVHARYVSGTFFRTLGVQPALGRTIAPADDLRGGAGGPDGPVAVLSDAFWRREYGAARNIIGRPIRLNGHPVTIVGVLPRGFAGIEVGEPFEIAVPLAIEPLLRGKDSQLTSLTYWWLNLGGRLRAGQTLTEATAGLQALTQSVIEGALPPDIAARRRRPYLDGSFSSVSMETGTSIVRERYRTSLMLVMAIVALVLLVTCTNLASLLLARATARRHEFAVRLALGAGRARLVRQLLIESLLLAAAGATLGLAVSRWTSALLLDQLSSRVWQIALDVDPDWRVLLFTAGVAVLTAMLFGLAPAWRSTRVTAGDVLRSAARARAGGWRGVSLEKLLIVAQIACSMVLVMGAALFVRSFATLTAVDAGFDPRGVLLVDADATQAEYSADQRRLQFARILDALRAVPGVQHASASTVTPMGTEAWQQDVTPAERSGQPVDASREEMPASSGQASSGQASHGGAPSSPKTSNQGSSSNASSGDASSGGVSSAKVSVSLDVHASFNRISPDYLLTMGTALLAGRGFSDRDTLDSPAVALVNETFARAAWPGATAVGQRFWMGRAAARMQVEVVGLVRDSKYRSLRDAAPPTVFLAMAQDRQPFAHMTFELRAATSAADATTPVNVNVNVNAVTQAIARVDPRLTLDVRPFATQIRDSTIRERVLAMLSGFFGALALLIAGVGLYGMMSLAITRRRHELGIRIALGADARGIIALVLRDVATIATLGLTTGAVIALASGRLIGALLFGLTPTDPATCALATLLLASVTVLAGYVPARRAARVDPMIALREE
jgi:putative ABC transport system permease protein